MDSSLTPITASLYPCSDLEPINYPLEFPLGLPFGDESEDNIFDQAFDDFTSAIENLEQQEKAAEYMVITGGIDLQPQYQLLKQHRKAHHSQL